MPGGGKESGDVLGRRGAPGACSSMPWPLTPPQDQEALVASLNERLAQQEAELQQRERALAGAQQLHACGSRRQCSTVDVVPRPRLHAPSLRHAEHHSTTPPPPCTPHCRRQLPAGRGGVCPADARGAGDGAGGQGGAPGGRPGGGRGQGGAGERGSFFAPPTVARCTTAPTSLMLHVPASACVIPVLCVLPSGEGGWVRVAGH